MCTKRVFTKNDLNINYKDYYTLKSGNEILKAVKIEDNNAILSKFINYNSWQTLSTSYFKNLDSNIVDISYVKSLYNSDESFIDESCRQSIDMNCQLEKNTLYPYGKIISKKEVTQFFPSNIYLCNWCNKNTKPIDLKCLKQTCFKEEYICDKKPPICKCECKKYKKLFI